MTSRSLAWLPPAGICLLLGLPLLWLVGSALAVHGDILDTLRTLATPAPTAIDRLLLYYAWWPRFVMALLAGAGLAVAGVLMQQVLRNPLASPTTLGVASGANLALMASTLLAPGLLAIGREWIALAGGGAAVGLTFLLSWRRGLAPTVIVLAGLVVNLYLGALSTVLLLFHHESLNRLLIWSAGSLVQNGWDDVAMLWPRLLFAMLTAMALLRPLRLLELDDANMRSLGVPLKYLRLAGLGLAVALTGSIVSVIGVIGFIGLAAPNIIALAGGRTLVQRLFWSPLLGALLLALTDQLLQRVGGDYLATLVPTGAITSLLGAPLLLWLIPRLRMTGNRPRDTTPLAGYRHLDLKATSWLPFLLASIVVVALLLGQGVDGWYWLNPTQWPFIEGRLNRLLAAASSGVMLAVSGTVLQRLSANPMASPEVLGISGGSAIAVILGIYLLPAPSSPMLAGVGTLGACLTLGLLLALTRRRDYAPGQLLLAGVAIGALFNAVSSIILVSGDPRTQQVLAWITGSTYYATPSQALLLSALACLATLLACRFNHWLDILPLGGGIAQAIGIDVKLARLSLLLLVAAMTASATLIVGPLSFIGLLAPHLARMLGFTRALHHLLGAALLGALLMIVADWLGRQLLFPNEIPAGTAASLIGGAYFMLRLRRL
ncbi:Fe(3+)-hydroxamate ABC transporter permease FhuB [Salinicola peritrichatus]|uniref:Fe(3+)-hydroxamate ABC transporter permease FhuB n=1 Tax=Salinicola peritrichatus TaxID=1267424 RepID=UPI000DA1AA16|nr:Fe(3+)-hydroxamate ABC transporter permease FhuB [Salinicola peritrichatus]